MPLIIFLLGLCIGSFLNVLADRLPRGESVLWGRSHCDWCKKTLRWYELIPVVSYIIQRGRCLRCHKPLSIQYPLVELLTAFSFIWIYNQFLHTPSLLPFYYILFSSLLVLFIADLKYQILPDSMIVIGTIGALGILAVSAPLTVLPHHLIAAVGSFAFLYLLWALTRGRGMGFGDVKLALLMGMLLGYPGIIIAFYAAFLTGALVGVILILVGRKGWKSKIAFGPFLILGTVAAFVWSPQILLWWHNFL